MPNYRRAFVEGASYCFTLVTFDQLPILTKERCGKILHDAWLDVSGRYACCRKGMRCGE